MKPRILVIITAAISLLTFGLVLAPPASAAQSYGWSWMDGSASTSRTFASSDYSADSLYVLVEVVPVYPRHTVVLEYYQDGRWVTESRGATSDIDGQIALALDPMCNGSWCDGTWSYRLRILRAGSQRGATVRLQVTYVNDGGGGTGYYDTYLYDRSPVDYSSSGAYRVGDVTVNGSTWSDAVWLNLSGYDAQSWVEFDVSDCWRFTALVGLDDASPARYLPVILEISGSSGLLGRYSLASGGVQSISIDLSTTDRLLILAYNSPDREYEGVHGYPSLAEPVLTCAT